MERWAKKWKSVYGLRKIVVLFCGVLRFGGTLAEQKKYCYNAPYCNERAIIFKRIYTSSFFCFYVDL